MWWLTVYRDLRECGCLLICLVISDCEHIFSRNMWELEFLCGLGWEHGFLRAILCLTLPGAPGGSQHRDQKPKTQPTCCPHANYRNLFCSNFMCKCHPGPSLHLQVPVKSWPLTSPRSYTLPPVTPGSGSREGRAMALAFLFLSSLFVAGP